MNDTEQPNSSYATLSTQELNLGTRQKAPYAVTSQ